MLPEFGITDLSTSWRDGLALSGLINKLKPGVITNITTLDSDNALENIRTAMVLAEKTFEIPQVCHLAFLLFYFNY